MKQTAVLPLLTFTSCPTAAKQGNKNQSFKEMVKFPCAWEFRFRLQEQKFQQRKQKQLRQTFLKSLRCRRYKRLFVKMEQLWRFSVFVCFNPECENLNLYLKGKPSIAPSSRVCSCYFPEELAFLTNHRCPGNKFIQLSFKQKLFYAHF